MADALLQQSHFAACGRVAAGNQGPHGGKIIDAVARQIGLDEQAVGPPAQRIGLVGSQRQERAGQQLVGIFKGVAPENHVAHVHADNDVGRELAVHHIGGEIVVNGTVE